MVLTNAEMVDSITVSWSRVAAAKRNILLKDGESNGKNNALVVAT